MEAAIHIRGSETAPPRRAERCNSWCDYGEGSACRFCGWPKDAPPGALRVWDAAAADYRDATQLDLDELTATVAAYEKLRDHVAAVHAELQGRVRAIKSRAGVAHGGASQ